MNICLINNIFPPILTGSSIFTIDLATQLQKNGHNVVVITSKTEICSLELEVHSTGFKLYRLDRLRLFRSNLWMNFPDFYFTLFPSNFKRIRGILKTNNIQIIHQCNNIFDLVFASAYFAKKLKIPLVCSLMTQIQHVNPFLNKLLEIFDKTIVRNCFAKYVDVFVAGDKETARYINERYGIFDRIHFLHLGISNLESFANVKRNYKKSTNILVSVGHVSSVKDRKELITSLPAIKARIPGAKIKIIGSLFSKKIEIAIRKNSLFNEVLFTGKVERDQIPDLIVDADVGSMFFSNVPYCKGVGAANIELMASGLPVILDAYEDNFGPNLPFKNGIHFIKLESRDPKWLANKIIELYENPALREQIGSAGKQFVLEQLSWVKITPLMEQLYVSILSSRKIC
jgi:glycosyltransferase involved in cell wall biosynthesis